MRGDSVEVVGWEGLGTLEFRQLCVVVLWVVKLLESFPLLIAVAVFGHT